MRSQVCLKERSSRLIDTPSTALFDAKNFFKQYAKWTERPGGGSLLIPIDETYFPVFSNQYLSLPANHVARIELEVQVKGSVPLDLHHSLRAVPMREMPSAEEYRESARVSSELLGLGEDTLGMRPRFIDRRVELARTERTLPPDDVLSLVYTYSTDEDLDRLDARLAGRNDDAGIAGLIIRKAHLSIEPLPDGVAPSGLTIVSYSHRMPAGDVATAAP